MPDPSADLTHDRTHDLTHDHYDNPRGGSTDHHVDAHTLASRMPRTAHQASAEYLAARRALLADEIELRRHMERVAGARRALPPGPIVRSPYVFHELDAQRHPVEVPLSSLFANGGRSLVVYAYMFPRHPEDTREGAREGALAALPIERQPCPSCTALLDQLDAAVPHFEAGGGNFVALADAPLEDLDAVAKDRGWRHLRLLSSLGTTFKADFHALGDDGQQAPMTLVFERGDDDAVRLTWSSDLVWADADPGQHHRAAGTLEPFWNLFDLTRDGRPDFDEQMHYTNCCSVAPRG